MGEEDVEMAVAVRARRSWYGDGEIKDEEE